MPSFFSKIRHRKTGSTSSTHSNPSSPTPASPTTPSRAAFTSNNQESPSAPRVSQMRATEPPSLAYGSDNLSTDKPLPSPPPSTGTYSRDPTGHSAPFADESDRPQLPTTTSNVNNPIPEVQASGGGQGRLHQSPFQPASTREVGRSNDTGGMTSLPPLPHVTSTDRDHLSSTDRPGMVASASRPQRASEDVAGEYPHASSLATIGAKPSGPRDAQATGFSQAPSNFDLQADARAAEAFLHRSRSSSQSSYSTDDHGRQAPRTTSGGRQQGTARKHDQTQLRSATGATSLQADLRSSYDFECDQTGHIKDHLARFGRRSHPDSISARHREEYGHLNMPPGSHPELENQRHKMVSRIFQEANDRKSRQTPVSGVGQKAFHSAGMGQLLGQPNTVDVHTKWLEPVVQENIYRTEHTEYMTIINREIHKYHIYPKIQPIYDPNPTRLPTRHRIFSSADQKWHEVVGDEAAIEILGPEAFRNGKHEYREERRLALPALDGSDSTDPSGSHLTTTSGSGSGLSSKMKGLSLSGGQVEDGIGRGEGRVLHREYLLGQNGGEWKEVARLGGGGGVISGRQQQQGQVFNAGNRNSVGVAL